MLSTLQLALALATVCQFLGAAPISAAPAMSFKLASVLEHPCAGRDEKPRALRPRFAVININRYLKAAEHAAQHVMDELVLKVFPKSHIDVWAPPAHFLLSQLASPAALKSAAASTASVKDILLHDFYGAAGSYLVAVHESLNTEQHMVTQGFSKSPSKLGLRSARDALQRVLCSTQTLLASIKQTVPASATHALLQLGWYQFPVSRSHGRFQNHVRQYSLARGLKRTAQALRQILRHQEQRVINEVTVASASSPYQDIATASTTMAKQL